MLVFNIQSFSYFTSISFKSAIILHGGKHRHFSKDFLLYFLLWQFLKFELQLSTIYTNLHNAHRCNNATFFKFVFLNIFPDLPYIPFSMYFYV